MKKPERFTGSVKGEFKDGYNTACLDWEKFLPSEVELLTMLTVELQHTFENGKTRRETAEQLAKTISKRLRGDV